MFIGGEPSHEEFEVHRIFVSNGTEKAGRVFGVGAYAGKKESIPDDFAIIEQHLKDLRAPLSLTRHATLRQPYSSDCCRLTELGHDKQVIGQLQPPLSRLPDPTTRIRHRI